MFLDLQGQVAQRELVGVSWCCHAVCHLHLGSFGRKHLGDLPDTRTESKELMPGRPCCEPAQLVLPNHGITSNLLACKGSLDLGHAIDAGVILDRSVAGYF